MPNRLYQYTGHDAIRRSLHQLQREAAADAVAHEEELLDAEMVHQPKLIVGESTPGIIDRDRQ